MTHKALVSFIGRSQKTAKTECGRTVKVAEIAVDRDCECLECRAQVDKDWRVVASLAAELQIRGIKTSVTDLSPPANKYHTVYFF